ncbi:unnamed protein product [Heterobilharzia americana]|nr:unnamed protein product [Heterobilharzia americana]CAH8662091.1 unnamed protein product [Heterobilharzia americana]
MFISSLTDSSYCHYSTTTHGSENDENIKAKELFIHLNKIIYWIRAKYNTGQMSNTLLGLSLIKLSLPPSSLRKLLDNSTMVPMNTSLVPGMENKHNYNPCILEKINNDDNGNFGDSKTTKRPISATNNSSHIRVKIKNHLLHKIIHIILLSFLFNQTLLSINKNICVDGMRLPGADLALSPSSQESDSRRLPSYWVDSPVVKLLKTQKDYLDDSLQSENKIKHRISSIFEDKQAIQDLLSEMNAYYLTYGRPRYG